MKFAKKKHILQLVSQYSLSYFFKGPPFLNSHVLTKFCTPWKLTWQCKTTSILLGDTSTQMMGMFDRHVNFGGVSEMAEWDLDFRTLRGNTRQRRWRETRRKKTPLRPKLQMEKQVGNPWDFLGLFFVSPSLGCQTWRCQWSKTPFILMVCLKNMCTYIRLYLHFPLIHPDCMMGRVGGLKDNHEIFCALQICACFGSSDSG